MSDRSTLPLAFPNTSGSVVWGSVDDSQLDAIINDGTAPPVYRTQAAAEKRRRTVGMSGALKEAIMSGGQALQSATTKDKLAEGANYLAQPMLERMGNDLSSVREAIGPKEFAGNLPSATPPGMERYGGGSPDMSQLTGMPGRVYDMARGFLTRGADIVGRSMLGQGEGARQLGSSMMGNQELGARLPRGNVQDPLPIPMAREFPVERPDPAAIAASVSPTLLAQQAPQRSPTDAAIDAGAAAAQRAMPVAQPQPAAPAASPEADLNFSPGFMELAKKYIDAQDQEAPLSAEDKWLALARAGFGMAASQAPSFGQALGEGAMAGITQLQQVRAQRAEQAARRAQMGLQVAGTEAQLRQGDRAYELQKENAALARQKEAGDQRLQDQQIAESRARTAKLIEETANPGKFQRAASSGVWQAKKEFIEQAFPDATPEEKRAMLFDKASPSREDYAMRKATLVEQMIKNDQALTALDEAEVAKRRMKYSRDFDAVMGASPPSAGGEPAAEPATPSGVKSQLPPKEVEKVLANARKAIANGKSKEAVIKRLRDSGIDPSGL